MEALEIVTYLVWLVASVSFILALKFLASPKTAPTGNPLGAAGVVRAWGKLQGVIASRPVKYPGSQIVSGALALALVAIAVYIAAVDASIPLFLLFVVLALILGVQLVMPIGGAD